MYTKVHIGPSEGRVVVRGQGPLEQVRLQSVEGTLCYSSVQQAAVAPAVQKLRDQGLVVTDDPITRLESWTTGDEFCLLVSERSYFDSVMLKQNPQWGIRSQSLAVVAVTECRDGYLLEKRSDQVAALPGHFHPSPSGGVEPQVHPLQTLYNEAREELALKPEEISDVLCLGLVYGELSGVYQLVCRMTTELTYEEIKSRECEGAWERADLLCIPACPISFPKWISEVETLLTVGGRMALLLEGARRWGEAWFEEHLP